MPQVSPVQPPLPAINEAQTAQPVFGATAQQLADGLLYVAGYRGLRWSSATVSQRLGNEARRMHRYPLSGTNLRDVLVAFRPSIYARYLEVALRYTTAQDSEKTSPNRRCTVYLEKLDGSALDSIRFELAHTPAVSGTPDDDAAGPGVGVWNRLASPEPRWVTTGADIDPSPPVGDLTPRPLIVSANAGQPTVLRLDADDSRVLSVHWREIFEGVL